MRQDSFTFTLLDAVSELELLFSALTRSISSSSPELGSSWIIAPVFAPWFPGPTEAGGGEHEQDGQKRRTPAYDSENWLHVTRRWQWVTFLSYHRFIASALYRWEPVDAPLGIRCFSAARVPPPNQPPNSDIAPLQPYVKTAQAAIWLWVMEGGLNSPSEILEPVGKPQLFKCRKSWFYKMLIWSALGTSEQQGSEQEPPPPSTTLHLFWRAGESGEGLKERSKGGSVTKGGGGLVRKTDRKTYFYFVYMQSSVHLLC